MLTAKFSYNYEPLTAMENLFYSLEATWSCDTKKERIEDSSNITA